MKYSIIKCVNGNYSVHAEGIEDISAARVAYHQLCASLWNAPDVQEATVIIADQNLIAVDGYRETICHD